MARVRNLPDGSSVAEENIKNFEGLDIKQFREKDNLASLYSKIQNDDTVKSLLRKDVIPKTIGSATLIEKSNFSLNMQLSQTEAEFQKQVLLSSMLLSSCRKDSSEKKTPDGIYPFPNWVREREHLSWDFVVDNRTDFIRSGPIGALPPNVQESRLIDDMLFCLVGIDGDYIFSQKLKSIGAERTFSIDDSTNVAMKLLVKNMLPMFSYYSTIIRFVEEKSHYEQGLVNHALSAAIRAFLKDYFVMVAQLENQHMQHNLTLQKLWFYLQPSLATLEAISGIVTKLTKEKCFGGAALSVLHENTTSLTGSAKSREICHTLTRAAALPYFKILEKWIYNGVISDYYSEFLVESNESSIKDVVNSDSSSPLDFMDNYWLKLYAFRRDQTPKFLSKSADMILNTGKYLNVVRQCGQTVNYPEAKPIVYTTRESQYWDCIEPAFSFASQKLLDLLMDDADLRGRLESVKHYFLLDQGDFLVQFMDLAEEELKKDAGRVELSRLESLLELAIRTSVANEDKYKDDVGIDLLQKDRLHEMFQILMAQSVEIDKFFKDAECQDGEGPNMKGFDTFCFNYEVKWPLSIVLNEKAFAYYRILFRYLFHIKSVENALGRLWCLNKRMKSSPNSLICKYASSFALQQRMFNFVNNLDYYFTLEVIEPHWQELMDQMSKFKNVDEVLRYHDDFLQKCITDCMLSNSNLVLCISSILNLCSDFATFLQENMKSSTNESPLVVGDLSLFSYSDKSFFSVASCPPTEIFQIKVDEFEINFEDGIQRMLRILKCAPHNKQTSKVINLACRINFSYFYEEKRNGQDLEEEAE